ncbi:hypothetical protein XENTR_v10023964 [Xenopus tropicalis]|uniref:Chromosome 8 open reading frame 33 n=1 Tax=Xenopus tropicalis TaxID=8364 RepID=F6T8W8_XENTR|nr:uncharacterized protein c8orf33 [Xenopus tropicalis]XP_017952920.2 uncharacterized protein c8orf33 [Xenopus tropicalis]KAE8579248.1 hypothetical protein XENTR_v10023964 [Xenopus tropicalis]KAE8579249.1 hypothetical protein XENTR_v10023964 [Xenopus tropicalis]
MEEAPKGTFEDELEWCISQLEKGLLHLSPTARQVSDTQRILRVLRSRKAPFVKKRSVMNQVFGNYRLKMAEERKALESAAHTTSHAHIQEHAAQDSGSVAYRKCSKEASGSSGHWFTPSDNSFRFGFSPEELDQSGQGGSEDAAKEQQEFLRAGDNKDCDQGSILTSSSGFAFNFQIPEKDGECSHIQQGSVQEACNETIRPPSPEVKNVAKEEEFQSHRAVGSTKDIKRVDASSDNNVKPEVSGKNSGDSPRKKKKKGSHGKKPTEANQTGNKDKKAGECVCPTEESKTGEDDLRRELDWCVEQLEMGLQRQKSTPKQMEEALRAVKILRSEKTALVRKRQVMRTMFGDYRRKMEEERQKQLRLMQTAAKSARISEVATGTRQNRSKVFRQCLQNSSRTQQICSSSSPSPESLQNDLTAGTSNGTSSQERFVFRPSEEPFCFNFI